MSHKKFGKSYSQCLLQAVYLLLRPAILMLRDRMERSSYQQKELRAILMLRDRMERSSYQQKELRVCWIKSL